MNPAWITFLRHEATLHRSGDPVQTCGCAVRERRRTLDFGGDDSGIEHGVHRQHGGECCSASFAGQSRRDRSGFAVGGRGVRPVHERSAADWRVAGGFVRTGEDVPFWGDSFYRGFGRLRRGAGYSDSGAGARGPRSGRGFFGTGESVDHQRFVWRKRSRAGDWDMVGIYGNHGGGGAGAGWMADRSRFVALGFFYQRADGGGGDWAGAVAGAGKHRGRNEKGRLDWGVSGHRGIGGLNFWIDRGSESGMEQPGGLGNDRNWDYFFVWVFGG